MLRESEAKGLLGKGVEHHERADARCAGSAGPRTSPPTCAFLVSDEAGYVTGQVIGVNGGRNT